MKNNAMQIMDSPAKIRREITVADCEFAVEIFYDHPDGYTAECPMLGVDAEGDSADEAYDHIIWVVTFFLETGLEYGSLQKDLAALNTDLDPDLFAKVSAYYADRDFKCLKEDTIDYSKPQIRKTITAADCDFVVEIFADSDGDYIVKCPALKVCTQAENEQGAYDNIIDAVTSFLEVIWDLGELRQELERRRVDPAIWEKVSKYYARTRGKIVLPEPRRQH